MYIIIVIIVVLGWIIAMQELPLSKPLSNSSIWEPQISSSRLAGQRCLPPWEHVQTIARPFRIRKTRHLLLFSLKATSYTYN